jgi:endonuclease/exonuclease/phosphatase family metal-dependent hydrolase
VKIANVHLQSGMMARGYREQVKRLMECIVEDDCKDDKHPAPLPETKALVVGGDFNTWNSSLAGHLESRMEKSKLQRVPGIEGTFSKSTGHHPEPRHTFDYFFATPDSVIGAGRVGADRTGSDHFPIAVELKLPER